MSVTKPIQFVTLLVLLKPADFLHCFVCLSLDAQCDIVRMEIEDCQESGRLYWDKIFSLPPWAMYRGFNLTLLYRSKSEMKDDTLYSCGKVSASYKTTSVIYFLAYGCVKNSTIANLKLLSKQSFHRHVIHLQANACYHDLCNKSMTWDVNKWLLGMAVLVAFCKLIY